MNNTSSSSEEPSGQHQGDEFEVIWQLVPIAMLIVITNGLVFLLFGKLRSLRTPANYFLLSLAVSDVMTGLINIPLFCVLSTLDYPTLENMNGSIYCATEVFHNMISCSVAYHITAITVEKYLAVVNPFGRFLMTKKTVVKILSTVWLWSASLGAIPASWWSAWWKGERLALYVQTGNNIFSLVVVFVIDPFKVNTAILLGVQNYWGERAANHELQCKWLTCAGRRVIETPSRLESSFVKIVLKVLTLVQIKDNF